MYPMWWSKNLATRSSAALAGKARLLHRRVERREPRFARIRAPPGPALRHGMRGSARTRSRLAGEDGVARLRRRKALSGGERTCGPAEGSNDLNVTREAALVAYHSRALDRRRGLVHAGDRSPADRGMRVSSVD